MKRSKFTEEQIASALRQADTGTPVGDVCRQVGTSKSVRMRNSRPVGSTAVATRRWSRAARRCAPGLEAHDTESHMRALPEICCASHCPIRSARQSRMQARAVNGRFTKT